VNLNDLMQEVRGLLRTREIKRLMPKSYKAEPFIGPEPEPVLTAQQREIATWNASVAAKRAARKAA
jgi:hypothetical protein